MDVMEKKSKYFCITAEILRNSNPPRSISECKIREAGYMSYAVIVLNDDRKIFIILNFMVLNTKFCMTPAR